MKPAILHRELLRWYEKEKRDLPWRRNKDPYRIWISEIMLQQTRVEAVLPYFERFLSNFPTVRDLAEADLDRVLNLWAGLGYYSRARNLHAAAKQVVENFGAKFPQGFSDLLSLKGVGPYTAAAIASMAFGKSFCALDGNLERVFARLLALRDSPKTSGRAALTLFGEELVALGRPGDVNQAVMDLASRICLPREPLCAECPIASHCAAKRLGLQRELPVKKAKAEKIQLQAAAWAVIAEDNLLLARRPVGEWLAGMWDLPWKIVEDSDADARPSFGVEIARCSIARTITKHKITFAVGGIQCEKKPQRKELLLLCGVAAEFRWVPLADLHGIHLPRPSEKSLEKILPKLDLRARQLR